MLTVCGKRCLWEENLLKTLKSVHSALCVHIGWMKCRTRNKKTRILVIVLKGKREQGKRGRIEKKNFYQMQSPWRRKWQPSAVFLPGESQGRGSLVGCSPWGRTESDTTEAP